MAGLDDVGPAVVDGGSSQAAAAAWRRNNRVASVSLGPGGDGAVYDLLDG